MKKNTTKRTTRHAELAGLIAAVMAHPNTPVTLYNAMADELSDMATYDHHSPEIIYLRRKTPAFMHGDIRRGLQLAQLCAKLVACIKEKHSSSESFRQSDKKPYCLRL
jgi:hypothetical protein